MSDITTFEFQDWDWHNLKIFPSNVTIKNIGGTPISIYFNNTGVAPVNDELIAAGINPLEIGGLQNEITTKDGQYVFGRAASGQGTVTIRVAGTLDPSEDISYLANVLNDTREALEAHEDAVNNPHNVTKAQVGLSNIPNAKSDDPTGDSSTVLATTKATNAILDTLASHTGRADNPHGVTKAQVGLGNVPNYRIANDVEAADTNNNAVFMTPKTTAAAVNSLIQIAYSLIPQTIMQGAVGSRLSGWSNLDCDYPSNVISKLNDTTIRVQDGLQVAYAENSKARISAVLGTVQDVGLPVTPVNGPYYIFANLGTSGAFVSFGMTPHPYKEGMTRDGHVGDFFSIPECKMYDSSNNTARRVYIGKCYVANGVITSVIPAPIGSRVIIPAVSALILGGRDLYDNPFVSDVNVKAEIEYNFTWGESGWNDQIGVKAHPYPTNPRDKIILQCGLMGFLACGREAGSPFGASFAAITTAPRARMIVEKKY